MHCCLGVIRRATIAPDCMKNASCYLHLLLRPFPIAAVVYWFITTTRRIFFFALLYVSYSITTSEARIRWYEETVTTMAVLPP